MIDTIILNGIKHKIVVKPQHEMTNVEHMGAYSQSELTIELSEKMPPDLMWETLLHEAVHAMAAAWLPRETQLTEAQTIVMTGAIRQLARENKNAIWNLLYGDHPVIHVGMPVCIQLPSEKGKAKGKKAK